MDAKEFIDAFGPWGNGNEHGVTGPTASQLHYMPGYAGEEGFADESRGFHLITKLGGALRGIYREKHP